MIIFTQTEQALILYKNNIQQERKAKRKECIYTALILYKNNIQHGKIEKMSIEKAAPR